MTFHSGVSGKATINGTEVPITAWSVDPSVRIAGTDNSMSGGFILRESSGGKTADFTIVLDYDFDSNPFATPIGLVIGAKITNVKLYLNDTTGVFWNFPSAVVARTPQNLQHAGTDMIGVPVNFQSDGTFSYPGPVTP